MEIALRVVVVIVSYLLGSIPSAYIAGRVLKGIDIRNYGDGHVGALNADRHLGRAAGAAVSAADIGKGYLAIWLAIWLVRSLGLEPVEPVDPVVLLSGLAVVAGHCWPIYIGFRGGGGQATTVGVFFALIPWAMLITAATSGVFYFTGKITAAGLIMFVPLWLVALLMGEPIPLVVYSLLLPAISGLRYWRRRRATPGRARQTGGQDEA
ncbi:MAG: glycerol-3-phosphate acyltransferase [Dehalococcoidia bacterium]